MLGMFSAMVTQYAHTSLNRGKQSTIKKARDYKMSKIIVLFFMGVTSSGVQTSKMSEYCYANVPDRL